MATPSDAVCIEGGAPHIPGSSDSNWAPVSRACEDLDRGLQSQDEECADLQRIMGTLHMQEELIDYKEVSACLDAFAHELEQCLHEKRELERINARLVENQHILEARCLTLDQALDRAARFDEDRVVSLKNSEKARDRLQIELRESEAARDRLQTELKESETARDRFQTEFKESDAARDQIQTELKTVEMTCGRLQVELEEAVSRCAELEQESHNKIREIRDLQQATQSLNDTIAVQKRQKQVANNESAEAIKRSENEVGRLQMSLDRISESYRQIERDNVHWKQANTLAKHSQAAVEAQLAQARQQLQQSDKLLTTTQRALDKAAVAKRKREKEKIDMEKKIGEQEGQISKLCSTVRQMRTFFHSVEAMDANDASCDPNGSRQPFQFGRIVKELDRLSSSVEGL